MLRNGFAMVQGMSGENQSAEPALFFSGVTKSFSSGKSAFRALDQLDLTLPAKQILGVIGPDGAGKTTAMRLAAGLLLPDEGNIRALGVDVVSSPLRVQQNLGYMPQRFGLYEDLSVSENLDLYANLQGVLKKDRTDRYRELMKMTGLGNFKDRLAGNLSGGMKQKLGLACSLVRSPRLLLLDEPTAGVDPLSRRDLWDILYRLLEDEDVAILLSTAYLDEAERCHEVLLLHKGKVLGKAPPHAFSEEMDRRSFQVSVADMNKRSLQENLVRTDGILDAVIHGAGVRVLTDKAHESAPENLIKDIEKATIESAIPRFEDSFVARLMEEKGHKAPLPQKNDPLDQKRPEGEVIAVKDVKRRFGSFYAVNGISFRVHHGEVFGLLGANGAGKSTTFRMLCGLLPASEGSLRVAGRDLRKTAAKARANIGYMAQRFSLYENLSVLQNLNFFSRAYGLKGRHRTDRIDWAMKEFELARYRETTSGMLPLGYRQRLALAAALMHEPEILFLDEPTSGVDPMARREFWHRINLLSESGVTILVTTHFMEEAEYCDRLVIMFEGEIMAEGTPEEMKAQYETSKNPAPTMEEAFVAMIEERRSSS